MRTRAIAPPNRALRVLFASLLTLLITAAIAHAREATPVSDDPARYAFEGDVVLVHLSTDDCAHCGEFEAWIGDQFVAFGDRGLAVLHVNTRSVREWGRPHVAKLLRANGLDWSEDVTDQVRAWRFSSAAREWPAILVFDTDGALVYAGMGPEARYHAGRAITTALDIEMPLTFDAAATR